MEDLADALDACALAASEDEKGEGAPPGGGDEVDEVDEGEEAEEAEAEEEEADGGPGSAAAADLDAAVSAARAATAAAASLYAAGGVAVPAALAVGVGRLLQRLDPGEAEHARVADAAHALSGAPPRAHTPCVRACTP